MEITKARFIGSATNVAGKPKTKLPEFAFIGRSNVGKSSLINMLCNNGELAKTSSKPGKTVLINHFLINEAWYIVDLPGYGYANRSKTEKEQITRVINDYLYNSEELEMLFVLPEEQRHGYGKALVNYAINEYNIYKVDVNEENEQAYKFYLHMGYKVVGRDELDSFGKPFPIIHLQLPS